MKTGRTVTAYILSILLFCAVWECVAYVVHASLILPHISECASAFFKICSQAFFWQNIGITCFRCLISFLISVVSGTILGVLCGTSSFFHDFSALPLAAVRATPVVSFILIALFWFTSGTVPVFVSILMALPVMENTVENGVKQMNPEYDVMASVYRFTKIQKMRILTIPQIKPFFLSGCVSTFGLSWKVTVAGEVLSLPQKGAGTMLQTAQVHLETDQVAAITVVLVIISFTVEKLFTYLIKNTVR